MTVNNRVGFGSDTVQLAIYVANRPPIDVCPSLNALRPLGKGELHAIVAQTSNHWRKLFNVYAKFLFSLEWPLTQGLSCSTWQNYRDDYLLQGVCGEALLFSCPDYHQPSVLHIIAGKTYAKGLALPFELHWLDEYFALNLQYRTLVCPYLDYRQLSDSRIARLVDLSRPLLRTDIATSKSK